MIELIVNADDFGLSKGVNYGIIEAHLNGLVNSTTMMMNMPAAAHAAKLAKAYPSLRVGVHLVLTAGKPLRRDVPGLMTARGTFHPLERLSTMLINPAEVEAEWRAQIEACLALGIRPTHLDSHHHVHGLRILIPIVEKLSAFYGLPVRRWTREEQPSAFSDVLLTDFYGDGAEEGYFESLRERVEDGQRVEVMVHPGFLDAELLRHSSYTMARVKELEILTNSRLPDGVQLI